MMSVLSVIICLVTLGFVIYTRKPQMDLIAISQKIGKLENENKSISKSFQAISKSNVELRRQCNLIMEMNSTLVTQMQEMNIRVGFLEGENKRILTALENHKLISKTAVVKPFTIKLVK